MSQLSENFSPGRLHTDTGRTIGFDLQPLPDGLEPPTSIEPAVTRILLYLEKYLWVLNNNGSISFNRGESPFSTQLCERLSRLFTTPKPHPLEGPFISWVQVVLFAGPSPDHLNQTVPLKVGDSTIQLSEEDHKSLLSGRPWRFLDPWPDERDCQRELALANEDLDDLRRVKDMLSKAVESVDGVERQLSFRRDILSQTPNAQPQPSAFESCTSSDIGAIEHVVPRTTELSIRKDASGDESIGQECNVESANGFPDSPPHESRDSSQVNGSAHSTSTAEEEYVYVAQLSTCEISDSEEDSFGSQATENLAQRASQDKLLSTPKPISPFIQKLVELDCVRSSYSSYTYTSSALENPKKSELIGWSDDGDSFIIHNRKGFVKEVLPSICPDKTYQNFLCLLWHYDFQLKHPSPNTHWSSTEVREYFNRNFRRGDKESLPLIQAQWKKSPARRAQTGDAATPSPSARAASLHVGSNGSDNSQDGPTAKRTGGPHVKFCKRRRLLD